MTHPNLQTNGASLEDCHTNFFALTELSGIKWRKLVWSEMTTGSGGGGGGGGVTSGSSAAAAFLGNDTKMSDDCFLMNDPILRSYSRCLAADILCVWRRIATPTATSSMYEFMPPPIQPPPLSLQSSKELWIFWYGEEPDLSDLLDQQLLKQESDQGSWESGLSYECRSLLFKALHNLIERCLLSRDFIRLGKWFVQPYDSPPLAGHQHPLGAPLLHPAGNPLSATLGAAASSLDDHQHAKAGGYRGAFDGMPAGFHAGGGADEQQHLSFSFAFFVHGESSVCASIDVRQHPPVRRLNVRHLIQAKQQYGGGQQGIKVILAPFGLAAHLTGTTYKRDASTMRLLDEWTQFYPLSSYLSSTSSGTQPPTTSPHHAHLHQPPQQQQKEKEAQQKEKDLAGDDDLCVVEVIVGGVKMRYPSCYVFVTDMDSAEQEDGKTEARDKCEREEFKEVKEEKCDFDAEKCDKGDKPDSKAGIVKLEKGEKNVHAHVEDKHDGMLSTNLKGIPTPPPSPPIRINSKIAQPGPFGVSLANYASMQRERTISTILPERAWQDCLLGGSSGGATSSTHVGGHEYFNPLKKSACTCSKKTPSSSSTKLGVVVVGGGDYFDDRPPFHRRSRCPPGNLTPHNGPPSYPRTQESILPSVGSPSPASGAPSPLANPNSVQPTSVPPQVDQMMPTLSPVTQLHEPAASSDDKGAHDDAQKQPAEKDAAFEPEPIAPILKRPVLTDTKEVHEDDPQLSLLYDYTTMNAWMEHPVKKFKPPEKPFVKKEIKTEVIEPVPTPPPSQQPPVAPQLGLKRPGDPYEFNEDPNPMKKPQKDDIIKKENLFTSEGLQPSYKDLEQIFEHSDNSESDDTPLQTPPDSNKSQNYDIITENKKILGILRPEELSKMFPTPPSLEHPIVSPLIGDAETHGASGHFAMTMTNIGSPREEDIDDWSYVFRPPLMNKLVGSSKYAPLMNLPSIQSSLHGHTPQPPVYKPSWIQEKTSNNSPSLPSANSLIIQNMIEPSPKVMDEESPASTNSSVKAPMATDFDIVTMWRSEVNALRINLLLADTLLNIFRDHNFDSCTLCVCNATPKCVGNLRGADAFYLHEKVENSSEPHPDDEGIKCSCGFSAIVNRRLAYESGLFYEDELEITGIAQSSDSANDNPLGNGISIGLLEILREQCHILQTHYYGKIPTGKTKKALENLNILEFNDGNNIISLILEVPAGLKLVSKMHKWPFLKTQGPRCNQDIVRVMKGLQPLLQTAIQKKCQTRLWEPPSAVKGPLTWRQFHRLAGRGTDDRCEPQPIPTVLVGHEKEWLSLSPYALAHWETLLLEPYSYPRDVVYMVLAPDNDYVLHRVKRFFKELSIIYEMCKLGRHSPLNKQPYCVDGIVRLKDDTVQTLNNFLAQLTIDYHLLETIGTDEKLVLEANEEGKPPTPRNEEENANNSNNPGMLVGGGNVLGMGAQGNQSGSGLGTNENPNMLNDGNLSTNLSGSNSGASVNSGPNTSTTSVNDDGDKEAPALVLYFIDSDAMGSDSHEHRRQSLFNLLKCYEQILRSLGDHIRNNISLQIISLESILELGRSRQRNRQSDHLRALSLSVFAQSRRHLQHSNNVKTLTGFGTAANTELFLKNKDEKNKAPFKLYTPPYILGPMKAKSDNFDFTSSASGDTTSIMYISYCLSSCQTYLLAVATDDKGEIFETSIINIFIPNRYRRKKTLHFARRIGLEKLMDFVMEVISKSVKSWRLVIGRIGRIGHGELKTWSFLLSRKNLLSYTKMLKELCIQCSLNANVSIVSACLVSLEADSRLRLMPDQFTPDERFSQIINSSLNTPQDVSCTHILVFPTSATTQSSQTTFQEQNSIDPDDEFFNINELNEDIGEHFNEDFNDIFNWPDNGQVENEIEDKFERADDFHTNADLVRGAASPSSGAFQHNLAGSYPAMSEEIGTVLQQPLALGYLVSTAPMCRMPKWFWSTCPHLEDVCPVFLKNALHLHCPNIMQNSEEFLQQSCTTHALDSQYTTDVLRYVLEGYNALSWLALDNNTRDRLSCLPVHIQVLMQLYHTTSILLSPPPPPTPPPTPPTSTSQGGGGGQITSPQTNSN